MFYEIFADERDNPVNKPNIYIVERNNMLSPGLRHAVVRSTTRDNRKCVENLLVRFRACIVYTGKCFLVVCKTKHSIIHILEYSFVKIKQLSPSCGMNIKVSTVERRLFSLGLLITHQLRNNPKYCFHMN